MRRLSPCSVLSLVFVLLLALAGCKTVARGDYFEDKMAEVMKAKGNDVRVDCPENVALGRVEDNQFQCRVTHNPTGESITVDVKVDEQFNIMWRQSSSAPTKTAPDDDGDPWN